MPATTFQATVGTDAVQASGISGLSATAAPRGVRVCLPSGNSGSVYYGFSSDVDTSTGYLLLNGAETTINPAEYGGNLDNLYFVASGSGQTVTGVAVG